VRTFFFSSPRGAKPTQCTCNTTTTKDATTSAPPREHLRVPCRIPPIPRPQLIQPIRNTNLCDFTGLAPLALPRRADRAIWRRDESADALSSHAPLRNPNRRVHRRRRRSGPELAAARDAAGAAAKAGSAGSTFPVAVDARGKSPANGEAGRGEGAVCVRFCWDLGGGG